MYQVMRIGGIWLETRRKSAHTNITQMVLSMCSSRYCSTFAPLFSLFFVVVLFWDSLTFPFYFFDIFCSLRSTKVVTSKNMSLNKWKTWPVENSEDVLKLTKSLWQRKEDLVTSFCQNKIFWTQRSWISISSTYLSCWPIHVPSTRYIKWYEQQEYD